jgi:hypothetical protein
MGMVHAMSGDACLPFVHEVSFKQCPVITGMKSQLEAALAGYEVCHCDIAAQFQSRFHGCPCF